MLYGAAVNEGGSWFQLRVKQSLDNYNAGRPAIDPNALAFCESSLIHLRMHYHLDSKYYSVGKQCRERHAEKLKLESRGGLSAVEQPGGELSFKS